MGTHYGYLRKLGYPPKYKAFGYTVTNDSYFWDTTLEVRGPPD